MAICTAFIVTGLVLNSFENLTCRLSPPMDTQTTCRSVLLLNPGAGGMFRGSTSCGAVLQVPTQTFERAGTNLELAGLDISFEPEFVNPKSMNVKRIIT